jgi:hypothetical protein
MREIKNFVKTIVLKHFSIFISILCSVVQPTQACLSPASETTIFFQKVPSQTKIKFDLAALVKIDGVV